MALQGEALYEQSRHSKTSETTSPTRRRPRTIASAPAQVEVAKLAEEISAARQALAQATKLREQEAADFHEEEKKCTQLPQPTPFGHD